MVICKEKIQRYCEVREVESTRLSNGSDIRSKREIGFKADAKDKRRKMLLTEVGRKLGGLVWEDENFGLVQVKFEMLIER